MLINSKYENLFFYKLPSILFVLIPFFLITGPLLSDLSVSLIAIIFLIYCLKKKNFSYFKRKYFYFFLAFWIYLVINSLINNFNISSFGTSVVYVRYGIFIIAVVNLLHFNSKLIKNLFYCLLTCFTFLILDGYFQYFTGANILGWEKSSRISSFFGEEKILGSYLSRLWPIFFGAFILNFAKKNKIYILIISIFILSEALVFLSGDRSSFFYINLSAIFVIILSHKLLKLRLFTLLSSFLVLFLISMINPAAKDRVIDLTVKQMNIGGDQDVGIYYFTKQHTHHYITAYRMFLDNKILGVGLKNFRNLCNDNRYKVSNLSCSTHPHNTFIQVLVETGIIGLFFLLFAALYFTIFIVKHLIQKFKGKYFFSDFEICILSGILIYLWPFVPTGNIFTNWLSIIMILNIPLIIWSREEKQIESQ